MNEDFEVKSIKSIINNHNMNIKKIVKSKKIYNVFNLGKFNLEEEYNIENLINEKQEKRNKIIQCNTSNRKIKMKYNQKIENEILKLKEYLPNFSILINYIVSQLKLNFLNKEKMFFKPILILGEPGLGKTYLINELSNILDIRCEFVDYGSLQNNFQLKGNPSNYESSKQGVLTDIYIESCYLNNVLILDEIDKNESKSVESVLYQLTEEVNSKRFKDEFTEIEIDLTGLFVFATANDITRLNKALLSRFQVFKIEKLDKENTKKLTNKMYLDLIKNYDCFDKKLSNDILDGLSDLTPREINSKLIYYINKSIENITLSQLKTKKDIVVNKFDYEIKKNKIGF